MSRSTLIALTAAAAISVSTGPAAMAKANFDFNVKIGSGGGTILIGTPRHGFDDGCFFVKVKHTTWNKWHTKKVTFFTRELVCY